MQAQAYEGYFENGSFHTAGRIIPIPERQRVYITVLDEPVTENTLGVSESKAQRLAAWDEFFEGIEQSDEDVPDFERVKFREVDI